MTFKKLTHKPDGGSGETHINAEYIVEIMFDETSWGAKQARVKYIGGGETKFEGNAVEALRQAVLTHKAD